MPQFSLVLTKNPRGRPRDRRIDEDGVDPGALPGRGRRPRHRRLISDAEVAEIRLHRVRVHRRIAVTARLVVRRVNDARYR